MRPNQVFDLTVNTRENVLEALHTNTYLNVNIIGICCFASDMSAELAHEVIQSLQFIGKLIASPSVGEVLRCKKA